MHARTVNYLARALHACENGAPTHKQTAHQVRMELYDDIVAIAETNTAGSYFGSIGRPVYCVFR